MPLTVLNTDSHPSSLGLQLPLGNGKLRPCLEAGWEQLPAVFPTASQRILRVGVVVWASSLPGPCFLRVPQFTQFSKHFFTPYLSQAMSQAHTLPWRGSQAGEEVGRWACTGLGRSGPDPGVAVLGKRLIDPSPAQSNTRLPGQRAI